MGREVQRRPAAVPLEIVGFKSSITSSVSSPIPKPPTSSTTLETHWVYYLNNEGINN